MAVIRSALLAVVPLTTVDSVVFGPEPDKTWLIKSITANNAASAARAVIVRRRRSGSDVFRVTYRQQLAVNEVRNDLVNLVVPYPGELVALTDGNGTVSVAFDGIIFDGVPE